jgi:hypothetical protein
MQKAWNVELTISFLLLFVDWTVSETLCVDISPLYEDSPVLILKCGDVEMIPFFGLCHVLDFSICEVKRKIGGSECPYTFLFAL